MALQTTGALKDTFVVFYAWVDMLPTITPKGNVCVCAIFSDVVCGTVCTSHVWFQQLKLKNLNACLSGQTCDGVRFNKAKGCPFAFLWCSDNPATLLKLG